VDPEVEARILAALRRGHDSQHDSAGSDSAGSESTVLVVAYRKATIALADQVVFVADGRVVDVGTHAELGARRPAYRRLVDAYERDAAERAAAAEAAEADEVLR
jgi:ABC-type multidrug transport system fused ATPase/permease subunit